jgi:Domain of unknown function (DUF4282)
MSGSDPTFGSEPPPPPPPGGGAPPPGPPTYPGQPSAGGPGPIRGDGEGPFFQRLFDLSFSRFVTPSLIKLLFVLAIAVASLIALFMLIVGLATITKGGIILVLLSPLYWLLGVIYARVFLELIIILFRIEDNTRPRL